MLVTSFTVYERLCKFFFGDLAPLKIAITLQGLILSNYRYILLDGGIGVATPVALVAPTVGLLAV